MINVLPVNISDVELVQATVFPNPTSGKLNFRLGEELNLLYELTICRLDGKLMMKHNFQTSEFTTDVSMLTSGEYIYRITGNGKKVYSGIFVKN